MEFHWGNNMKKYWDIKLESKHDKIDVGVNGEGNMLVRWVL